MLQMNCDDKSVNLNMDEEKLSMLITGRSRMGKTYFASLLGESLIHQMNYVHLIDLGAKWSNDDKKKLTNAGAVTRIVAKECIAIAFCEERDLIDCGHYIANALGFRSENASSVIKKIIKDLTHSKQEGFFLADLLEELEEVSKKDDWAKKIRARFESFGMVPRIQFQVNTFLATVIACEPTIWDLTGIDEAYVKVIATLIVHGLLGVQKNRFCNENNFGKIFVIIDEFQNLDCNRKSIIGVCLTEGQKYQMYVILITQFVSGQYSDAVINQFTQGGFRIYFRLTSSDAMLVSKQITLDRERMYTIYDQLMKLPKGQCLFIGSHTLDTSKNILESARFIKITDANDK